MNSAIEKASICLEEIYKQYIELKRGGNVDPFALKLEIRFFINIVKSEDMLIDVAFMINEDCCSPLKARSIK